jgi:hypothetical protein
MVTVKYRQMRQGYGDSMDTAKAQARGELNIVDAERVARTANPFGKIDRELWLARLREGAKWKFYVEQYGSPKET